MAYGYGQGFQEYIKMVNDQYRQKGLADIQPVPVPTVVNRQGQGFYKEKSIVDYIGFYTIININDDRTQSYSYIPVAFDAKETRNSTRFDLSYIKDHQYNYLKMRHEQFPGSENFILVECLKINRIYRIDFPELQKRWEGWKSGQGVVYDSNIASITFEWMKENLKPIQSKNGILLDYLNRK